MVDALLLNTTLVNTKGETIDGGDVGKTGLLALYFAANWCPDCRAFQSKLNDFYAEANASTQQLDIVFLSSDMSEEDQQTHFSTKHGDWWMVPRDAEIRNELRRKYGIRNGKDDAEVGVTHRTSGIPALVIVRPDGEVLDFEGVQQIESNGIKALANWQAKAQSKEQ
ncbi:hypothetical protein PC129_g7789 [Phytophthora cactorum]|nr:hypothetical protein Pcac1_g11394 [Phytophthora cactorum]KAG2824950.1 hypothetical protein PC112_g9909 [Phytophthora cactorum]KAG2827777.1 hypothetical protein PC111_g8452 [Phytophthora cactorum]KAG2857877.1 hypothetical protein PC113_g10313 [Phytophthora cactorum]KAG2908194.1 hypothetical protein PC114_g10545 [Phytophthora cactorum]